MNLFLTYLGLTINYVSMLCIAVFLFKFLSEINVYGTGLAVGILLYLGGKLIHRYVYRSIVKEAITKLKNGQ